MSKEIWHKRFIYARDHLCLYPAPEPLPRTRKFWLVMGLIALAVLVFCVFYISYLTTQQTAFQTNAEDFGIMDQAIWNTIHGHMLHQTICTSLGDTNCVGPAGFVRFAIHFEPILFPISLLYFIWSDPRVLLVLQTVVVALGAFPAFWLARLRLRNEWLAGVFALIYLIYPAQLQASTDEFHAVTMTAALLLFTLYFMYTRQTLWFFVFALLSMACKEEIPIVVATFGLWSLVFQRRWRSGLAVVVVSILWFVVTTKVIMPHFSPTGQALLSTRYNGAGGSGSLLQQALHPLTFLHTYLFDASHRAYIHDILAPAGYIPKPHGGGLFYLPLLAPWILVMATPSLLINLLSTNPQQYSGLFHYNAEIVPVIIFATIESLVVVRWLTHVGLAAITRHREAQNRPFAHLLSAEGLLRRPQVVSLVLISLLTLAVVFSSLRTDYYFHGQLPFSISFQWPQTSAHTDLAQRFLAMIPADASVSAQNKLVPHLSHRESIYMFPYADGQNSQKEGQAEYILLDVTGDIYPYFESQLYTHEVKKVLASGQYGIVAAQDGYLLLKRGLAAPAILSSPTTSAGQQHDLDALLFNLPTSFCSNIYVPQSEIQNPLHVDFKQPDGQKLHLVGFQVGASSPFSRTNGYGTLTTYWRVDSSVKTPIQLQILLKGSDGREYLTSTDMPDLSWCPAQTWQPGSLVRLTSRTFNLQKSSIPNGLAQMSITLLPQAQTSSTIMDVQARLPVQVLNAPVTVIANQNTNALQLMPITIVN
ncbi:DUF2079 domain-containing protein [Dictyobacter arantiisoli]|uniref:DUF2079 domain-containing protein n=1 Tax=Dictyobacter arantiisoli TaxID=2014874 RepID=A0A5A5T908_9CHLR|nr:DUF2079 domain-containing protein [Dictyobacter arantiisoli]GCF07868.1 hypothetical protein KDI_14320 [Dictyobacter arantiisoli]